MADKILKILLVEKIEPYLNGSRPADKEVQDGWERVVYSLLSGVIVKSIAPDKPANSC